MEQIATEYLAMLWSFFQYDISVFSSVWLYLPLLIPFIFYFIFFVFKWWILTLPIWLPFVIICNAIRGKPTNLVSIKKTTRTN